MNRKPFIFGALLSFVALLSASLSAGQPKQVEAGTAIETPRVQAEQQVKNELLGDSATYTIAKDTHFVIDVSEVSSWWYNDSAKTYIDFIYNGSHSVYEAKKITAKYDFLSYKLTASISFNLAIVVRGSSAFPSGPNWDDKVCWNQTIDIIPSSSEQANAVYIRDYKAWGTNKYEAYFGGDRVVAELYSRRFLSQSLCKDEGGLASGASNNWSMLHSEYSTYISGRFVTDGYLTNYVLDDSDESDTAKMLRRYEAVLRKNPAEPLNNFLERDLRTKQATSAGLFANSTAENSNYALIIILGSLALIATAAIFMNIKRRED